MRQKLSRRKNGRVSVTDYRGLAYIDALHERRTFQAGAALHHVVEEDGDVLCVHASTLIGIAKQRLVILCNVREQFFVRSYARQFALFRIFFFIRESFKQEGFLC